LVLSERPELAELAAFWRGDERAIETTYRVHATRLLRIARGIVGSAEAESVVQEVFVELIRNEELRRRFTQGTQKSMAGWLGAITRLKSLEHRRRAWRDGVATDEAPDGGQPPPEPRLEARDLLERFLRAQIVSGVQAEFFRRRFIDCHTQVEIAASLSVPRSTLEGWEHRLSERFRRFVWENS
jgi:DNA-directed RNA polymerase specialized sigma24 family protein